MEKTVKKYNVTEEIRWSMSDYDFDCLPHHIKAFYESKIQGVF